MVEPELGEYNVMLFWLKPNAYFAIPESETMPQRQALMLRGGVTTVSYLLDTSRFIHCWKEMSKMSESIYLMLGTDADKKRSSIILNEVSNAIYAMDVVAQSYGVAFSKTLIKQLYDELEKHIDSMDNSWIIKNISLNENRMIAIISTIFNF